MWRVLGCFVVCFLLVCAIAFGDDDPYEELERELKKREYGDYWDRLDALRKLGRIGDLRSTQIISTVLGDKEAAIREAAVVALSRLKDPEAIKWLASSPLLKGNEVVRAHTAWALRLIGDKIAFEALTRSARDASWNVRANAIEALAVISPEESAEILVKALDDRVPDVRLAAANSIALTKNPALGEALEKRVEDENPVVRAAILYALASVAPERALPHLEGALEAREMQTRIGALEGLLRADRQRALEGAVRLLHDKEWQVRATAIEVLKKIRKKDCIEPLIDRLAQETGRLRLDIALALRDLTEKDIGYNAKDWKNWWDANKDTFEMPSRRKALKLDDQALTTLKTEATFFDIPIMSDRIIFIIDFSGSMKYEEDTGERVEDPKDVFRRKVDIAMTELEKAVKRLSEEKRFNLILLSTEATRIGKRQFAPKMVTAIPGNRKKCVQFFREAWERLDKVGRGRGDIYDALMEAFADRDVDTIILLSDGKPTYGLYSVTSNFFEYFGKENRFRKIVVHTILTGTRGIDANFMEGLAEMTGGIYVQKK